MEHCQIYKQHLRQQICDLDFTSLKHCKQLNLISQCHCLPGVIDAWSPQFHINQATVLLYTAIWLLAETGNCTEPRSIDMSTVSGLIEFSLSHLGAQFAILLLGPSGRKWFGKFSLKKFKWYAYPSDSWMFIQQNSCFKCFTNGTNVNKALRTSLTCENYNSDFLD